MTTKDLIKALREKKSRDNRELLDEAAEQLELFDSLMVREGLCEKLKNIADTMLKLGDLKKAEVLYMAVIRLRECERELMRSERRGASDAGRDKCAEVDGDKVGTFDGVIHISTETKARTVYHVAMGDESDRLISLNDCLELIGYENDEVAIVIIDDALRGEAYIYGNYNDGKWHKYGETCGYARGGYKR